MKRLLICVALLSALAFGKDEMSWKSGVLLTQSDDRACGVNGSEGRVNTTCTLFTFYQVDDGQMIYTFRHARSWVWQKRIVLTVKSQVHFAFHDGHAYLQDESGKSHKVYLYAKEIKEAK